jgi:glutathione S-transferase
MTIAQNHSSLPPENIQPASSAVFKSGPLLVCKKLIQTFSTNDPQRQAPLHSKKTRHVRLITIGPSHFCEKVRWALDILDNDSESDVYYTEDAHPPLFNAIATLEASHGSVSMVPMIVCNGEVVSDSQSILMKFCPFLYPQEFMKDIVHLETYFGSHLGATIRTIIYYHTLQPEYYNVLKDILTTQTSIIESSLWGILLKKGPLAKGMLRAMKINKDSVEASLVAVRKTFDLVTTKLNENNCKIGSKKYLIGNRFTAADLAFCALASPIIAPPELRAFSPFDRQRMPPALVSLQDELRNTPAGQYVLEIYKNHRSLVAPKVVNRNRIVKPLCGAAALVGVIVAAKL